MKRKSKRTIQNFQLPDELSVRLAAVAEKTHRTKKAVVVMALTAFFAKQEAP